jgi:tRNA pseudouridine55 synthase
VEVYSIEISRYDYPELELRVRCGSGTYIRSLGRDLAESLGTGAVMSALRRLAIGAFTIESAIACNNLTLPEVQARLLPPRFAIGDLPCIDLIADEIARVIRGQTISNRIGLSSDEIAAVDGDGQLVAILKSFGEEKLGPTKCFVQT